MENTVAEAAAILIKEGIGNQSSSGKTWNTPSWWTLNRLRAGAPSCFHWKQTQSLTHRRPSYCKAPQQASPCRKIWSMPRPCPRPRCLEASCSETAGAASRIFGGAVLQQRTALEPYLMWLIFISIVNFCAVVVHKVVKEIWNVARHNEN